MIILSNFRPFDTTLVALVEAVYIWLFIQNAGHEISVHSFEQWYVITNWFRIKHIMYTIWKNFLSCFQKCKTHFERIDFFDDFCTLLRNISQDLIFVYEKSRKELILTLNVVITLSPATEIWMTNFVHKNVLTLWQQTFVKISMKKSKHVIRYYKH